MSVEADIGRAADATDHRRAFGLENLVALGNGLCQVGVALVAFAVVGHGPRCHVGVEIDIGQLRWKRLGFETAE